MSAAQHEDAAGRGLNPDRNVHGEVVRDGEVGHDPRGRG